MKIDRSKLKKSVTEVPADCGWLIEKLQRCSDSELLSVLKSIESWNYGKCELHYWVNVLDRFDSIFENATKKDGHQWVLPCDLAENAQMQELVVWVLYFTTLLVEHSFSRHLYSSLEHLITLLSSSSMTIVLSVLNLLYMFSKRSNYITRMAAGPKQALLSRLIHLAESWGGKENGFGLAQCCQNLPLSSYPEGATSVHFEFYGEPQKSDAAASNSTTPKTTGNTSNVVIHINNIQVMNKSPSHVMEELISTYKVPAEKQVVLFTHLRLAHSFARYESRLQCVQARLQAISILVYCNALQDNAHTVLYSGLLDEFVDVLELKNANLTEIKAATLRTLTSIIHLERYPNFPKLNTIIDVTGASSYHGFLPVMVRSCISTLTAPVPAESNSFPAPLATSLFSFLYHLASYEAGGEALVACGLMESLLSVVTWTGSEPDYITFVTRAVRVIDLITNLDMNAFQSHSGLNIFIRRLELEVAECRKDQPYVIQLSAPLGTEPSTDNKSSDPIDGNDTEMPPTEGTQENSLSPMDVTEPNPSDSTKQTPPKPDGDESMKNSASETDLGVPSTSKTNPSAKNRTCSPQRAALIKSMLNFLKKDIQDPGFSESMRHLMESSLPSSLKHIISNAEYYGPSLFLLATDVVTVYVFGEPSLLSSLQDNGLTDIVLHALLVKDVPATREVLASLPNVFSALCLNSRGLQAFVACKPFERLFKVLLSPDYLPAMRRRKSTDPMGDTASNLGNAMDELMRHQPSLKAQAMIAIVKLLQEVCSLGSDAHYVCCKTPQKNELPHAPTTRTTNDNSSDEEEEEEEGDGGASSSSALVSQDSVAEEVPLGDKKPVPLVDYVLNVMKFVDAILSNNSTDDHCKEFVAQKGLVPLLGILGLPNLPIDFPVSQACQAVASACKSILNLAHESGVLEQGLHCLHEKLEALAPLHNPTQGGSVLLKELSACPNAEEAINSPQSTPLLHTLSAIHAYIMMLVHVCRTGQADIRQVSIKQWGTELGLKVLAGLTKLYTSLVWESTVLLAFCSEDTAQTGGQLAKDETAKATSGAESKVGEVRDSPMEVTESENAAQTEGATSAAPSGSASTEGSKTVAQLKLVKPLLSSASRLGKALAELFGLLVKVCVGSPLRQRRGQQVTTPSTPPSPAAIAVANALSNVLQSGLSWVPPPSTPTPNIRLTFLISSVRFTNPMLFDDKKMPYHLMIQHFVKSNGLKAFFDIFHWALQPSESPSSSDKSSVDALPECTGEFLDTWLFLLEKLVNPKSMLESPHSLPAKLGFRPLLFLIQIQKMAFEAVLKLWNKKPLKNYGVKICESVLVILCSILKGESEIADRLNKEKAAAAAIAATEANTSVTPAPTMGAAVGTSTAETSDSLIPLPIPPPVPTSEPSTSTGENPPVSSSEDQAQDPLLFAPPLMVTATTAAAAAAAATAAILNPESSGVSGSAESRPLLVDNAAAPAADPFLQPLLDMGFPQERCLEAIANTTTLEQATEYLLLNSTSGAPVEGDMDFSEDEQWLHAVTMSLRESGTVTVSASPKAEEMAAPVAAEPDSDEEPLSKEELDKFTSTVLEGCLNQLDLQPQLVYKVCELLSTCVTRNGKEWKENMLRTLMAQISEEARLLTAAAANNKSQDTAEYLCTSEVAHKFAIRLHLITLLFEEMKTGCAGAVEDVNLVNVLIKLLCIAQEVLSAHPQILAASGKSGSILASPKEKEEDAASRTPKWLAPSMLLLDLYEKLAVATKRRAAVKKVTNHVWKWFDVSQVRWYSYTNSNNKIIDEAYWAGETSVRIINSRRKYTIQFHAMLQVNEETGNRRPVMICISEKRIGELKKKLSPVVPLTQASMTDTEKTEAEQKTVEMEGVKEDKETTEQTSNSTNPMECDEALTNTESEQKSEPAKIEPEEGEIPSTPQEEEEESFIIKGFEDNNKEKLIKACVGFMKLCIEPDTLHALMRLCLRLTREWENACLFSKMGGVRTLLTLNESSSFWGFQSLAALLMRHILEEPTTLKHTMKKVVRYAAGNSSGVGAKELHSLLRALAPAACRDSAVFTEAAQQCLRIDLNMAVKRNHLTTSNEDSILMKSIGSKNAVPGTATTPVSSQGYSQATDNTEPLTLIQDLLEALGMKDDDEANPSSLPNSTSVINSVGLSADERNQSFSTFGWIARQFQQLSRSSSANDMVLEVLDEQSPSEGDSAAKLITAESSKPTSDDTNVKRKKRLLSKSILCRLLAEFIRSYSGVAKIVTDHQYSAGTNDKITEDCSALAYLLDQLVNGTGESEMVNNVRVLIAALSSCNHAPDAQAIVVTEVKSCLSRVLILTENQEKHTKIQTIVGLILTMMESCPTQLNQPVNIFFKQQMGMNNIIRIMIKKNLVTDLARIPHSLDLSSPNMASTINAALKPLETVLRIVNMPSFVSVSGSKKKTTSTSEQHQPSGTSTTNSEATRAQGEENADDAENTEHDISGTGESLEPTSEANPNEDGTLVEGDEPGLEDVLDQLLEDRSRGQSVGRDSNRATPHRDGVTATVTYVIDHDVPMDIDDTLHDSRMVSHSESQFMDDDHDEDRNDEDDNDDASTGSSEDNDGDDDNEDQVEVEEDDDDEDEDGDDEDDDDDDDDEEEEEGSSVFDQGYEDLEETFIRLPVERESSDDNLLLLPSYQQYINTIDTIIFGDRISLLDNNVSHDDAFYMTSTPNPNNTSVTSAIPNHPLFQNPREVSNPVARVANRPSRQRGVFRYQTASNPRSHSNTSTILQRLIGQGNRDMAQLTPNIRVGTQLIIGNQDLRIIQQNDDLLDTQDFENNFVGCSRSTGSGTLPSVPNALTRWMEEARVLESDSLHDAVTQVKPDLMAVLECHRDVEQAEKDKKKELEGSAPKNSTDSKSAEASAESDSNSTSTVSTSTTTVTTTSAVGSSTASTNTANAPARNLIISILEQQFSSGTGTSTSNTSPTFSGLLSQMSASESERSLPSIPYSIPEPQVISYRSNAPLTSSFSLLDSLPISLSITNAVSSMVPELSVSAVPVSSVPVNLSQSASQNIQLHSSPLMTAPVPTISNADVSSISPPIPLAPSVIYQMPRTTTAPQLTIEESMSISPTEFSLMPTSTTVTMTISNNSTATSTVNSVDQSVTINPVPRTISEAVSFLDQQQQSSSAVASEASAQPEDQTTTDQENLPPVSSSLITAQGEVVAVTSGPSTSGAATRSQHDFTAILGDIEIPEGVDPSFLAALPEEMRQEVISEQLRIQRVRERATANSNTTEQNPPDASEVSAEFLAALPPNIQEEVLSQQRAEQQRQQAARANPDDPTSFLLSLPQSLRQTILADLEDSQFSALPTEVVQEAQTLRRQREDRTRHVHDHMFNPGGSSSISHILRTTARMGPRFMHSPSWSSWGTRQNTGNQQVAASSSKVRGQQVLDHESLSCLLILLFVDEPKLNTTRLHRVLKSLCQHPPTRDWVIKTLLSILSHCAEQQCLYSNGKSLNESEAGMSGLSLEISSGKKGEKGTPSQALSALAANNGSASASLPWKPESRTYHTPFWLSMSMDAALGCRASIFQIQRQNSGGKKTSTPSTSSTSVHIHQQAAPMVCRHAIDLLISLAKIFPSHFLPSLKETEESQDKKSNQTPSTVVCSTQSGTTPKTSSKSTAVSPIEPTDFWDLLVKLDSVSVSRKGKGLPRTHSTSTGSSENDIRATSLENSPLGQLIQQLAHPVIKRSSLLTDRLLRLLALVSLGHSDTADAPKPSTSSNESTKALEHLLGLSIEVLTSKSCSEEGLEDATALLLHLSHGPPPARDLVLKLLLQGSTTLGQTVTVHISSLLDELKRHNKSHPSVTVEEEPPQQSDKNKKKGLLRDRFTCDDVVISSSVNKTPCEVQLPSMSALTSKTSSQAFFLRTLKVIIQLREAIRPTKNRKKPLPVIANQTSEPESASASANQAEPSAAENPEPAPETPTGGVDRPTTTPSQPMELAPSGTAVPESQEQEQPEDPATTAVPDPLTADSVLTINHETVQEMEVDTEEVEELKSLRWELGLDDLWSTLSFCLVELGETADTHAVLVLQPAVEAFFLVHASAAVPDKKSKPATPQETREAQLAHLHHEIAPLSPLPASALPGEENVSEKEVEDNSIASDAEKFLKFAEKHRSVLNQILRQSTTHLADGPFSVLVDHTRLLDFDIKRKYFRTELERADDGIRREDLAVHVRREHVFEDSFRELHRRSPDEWKNRFYIVFEGEEGQDAGGLLREWYVIISREIFNPMYALFCTSPGDRVTYMINPSSHCNSNHLSYFKFVGRVIAKAIYDNKLLECYFTRSFYKHILGVMVRVADMESEDYSFYQGLIYLLEHHVADLGYELTFSTEVQEFGVTEARDLKPGGRNILVTEETKHEYIRLVCQEKMTGAIKKQLNSFLEGFYDIIPKRLISIFNEQELELLLSGLPTIDIDDLKNNTEYHKYHPNSLQIQWFWRALRSFDQAERAKLVQFVTGTSKVPLQGFSALEGMNGTQKFQIHRDDRSTDRLPSAHTCFNQLDLPAYETYDKLRVNLLKAVQECSEGFGFA